MTRASAILEGQGLRHKPFSCRDVVLVLLGALAFWLSFPNALLHLPPLVLLYPVVLALLGREAVGKVEALGKGWLCGLLAGAAALYWVALPVHTVGGLPWLLAAPCAMVIGAYTGLYGGLFSLCAHSLRGLPPLRRVVALGVLWYALEALRGTLFTGFPWLGVATAFAPWPFLIQAASLLGGYALGGVLVCCALLLAEALPLLSSAKAQRTWLCPVLGAGLLLGLGLWGQYILTTKPQGLQATSASFSVILVEGNVDQNVKWEPALQESTVATYIRLSREALQKLGPTEAPPLLVWPETAMPFYFDRHPQLGPAIARFVQEVGSPLLLGAPGLERRAGKEPAVFNRAYLLNPQGGLAGFYDKVHLVPFGEYLPPWLELDFLKPLLQGIGNFTPGRATAPLRSGNLALGVLICYESIFPEIARKRVADGANVLLNISNDGWFGDTAAPEQHLQLSMLRAVEQNRWLVRGTNTGISAVVDSHGRLVQRGTQFREQSLLGTAELVQEKSLYYHIAPWLPLAAALLLAVALLLPGRTRP